MHALASRFEVDCLVWQPRMDPTIVGLSLTPGRAAEAEPPPLIPIAMVNDHHFWGLTEIPLAVVPADAGDWVVAPLPDESATSGQGRGAPAAAGDHGDADADPEIEMAAITVEFRGDALPPSTVEAELALCGALRKWDPWAAPTSESGAQVDREKTYYANFPRGRLPPGPTPFFNL